MLDCNELIEALGQERTRQVRLAIDAGAPPVAAMHLDLAALAEERRSAAVEMCAD